MANSDDRDASGAVSDLARTADLLSRARAGDAAARAELLERYRVPLDRFLHGRLVSSARSLLETDDLAQEVYHRALSKLDSFSYLGIGSFWAFLRQIAMNLVAESSRRQAVAGRANTHSISDCSTVLAKDVSPLGALLKKEEVRAFDRALESISERNRHALLMRVELGLDYETIANDGGYSSAAAARMAVRRAIESVAKVMRVGGDRATGG